MRGTHRAPPPRPRSGKRRRGKILASLFARYDSYSNAPLLQRSQSFLSNLVARFISIDRLILGGVCRLFPKMYDAQAIVRPDTVIRRRRAGFRSYWRWKSRRRCGRGAVPAEIRRLIREMSIANPLWGAPRIQGELLKLGIEIGQTSVAKHMARRRAPPSQG